jgi:ribonucleoside-diphosphate reductase subunit M1
MLCSEEEVSSHIRSLGIHVREDEFDEIINEVMRQLPSTWNDYNDLNDILCNILCSLSHRKHHFDTIAVGLLQKSHAATTPLLLTDAMAKLQNNRDVLNNIRPLLDPKFYSFIVDNKEVIDALQIEACQSSTPFPMTSFGWKTLKRGYLIKTHEGVVETPDHLWLRIALFLYREDWESVRNAFIALREGLCIHATPTLFHAGLSRAQMASCFLIGTEDSVAGIFKTISDAAQISKWAGGIGVHISNIRGKNSYIHGTNGYSNGIMPMLKVYNDTSRYIDQGGGKRNGAFAVYIEPWHSDIFDFVSAKRNIGSEEERARDLFYAMWVPDLFMKQVMDDSDWYLMTPSVCPDLTNLWGERFETRYWEYVADGKFERKIKARELWVEILRSQIETGTPYMLYKDSCNRKSNQQNLGTIRSSNLCCEIIEYSDNKEYAVCNLASIALPRYVRHRPIDVSSFTVYGKADCPYCLLLKQLLDKRGASYVYRVETIPPTYIGRHTTYPLVLADGVYVGGFTETWEKYLSPEFDFERFGSIVRMMVRNLNRVIDINCYPLEECRRSNLRHRPIGIGVQGLADVFFQLRLPYDSPGARKLNLAIFESMYFNALTASVDLAQRHGIYDSFRGSPLSEGKFHFDLCSDFSPVDHMSGRFDWEALRANVLQHGVRNSLLIAPMPTASTSQILGNTESFEPLTNNLYVRRTQAGEFYVCNSFMRSDLEALSRWDNDTIEHLIVHKGSIQNMQQVPTFMKTLYRTVWEIPQKSLIDMAADRQFFIDQSQSFNIYLNEPNMEKLTKIHFYGWKKGLKTGSYYIRSRSVISSQNVTVDPLKEKECEACSA